MLKPEMLHETKWSGLRARMLLSLLAGVVALVAVVAFPAVASAHAEPSASTPSPDEVLTAAPTSVTISFSQNINPNSSDIVVYDSTGTKVTSAAAALVNGDLQKMSVPLHVQGQGNDATEFLVVWHTASVDDDETAIGAFSFTVNPNGDGAAKAPSSTSGASNTSGTSPLMLALVGILGILVGGAGGYILARSKRLNQ